MPALLLTGCVTQPSDEEQIRSVTRSSVAAINAGDVGAAYRLTDLDFRAVCPRERYAAWLHARRDAVGVRRVRAVEGISIRGVRGAADVTLDGSGGTMQERWQYVKDAGRWYLYEDAAVCGVEDA